MSSPFVIESSSPFVAIVKQYPDVNQSLVNFGFRRGFIVCCNDNTLQLCSLSPIQTIQKVNCLQYFQSQWYHLTCYTFNGCIFTPRQCKIVKIINNQPTSGPFCCFVYNMTKSYVKINYYASTPMYRIESHCFYE
jgi:hypothetical protein